MSIVLFLYIQIYPMKSTCYLSDIFEGDHKITQYFGENKAYYQQFGLAGHEGVDFATPVGTKVYAPFGGIILREGINLAGYHNYGIAVVVWDPIQKCAAWFGHLSKEIVSYGQKVKQGEVIGYTGNTGNTFGPHLHFGFVKTDEYGNRLYSDNGYIGFLDPLNQDLVTWRLAGNTPSADEYVSRAVEASRSLFNAVEAGSRVGDPMYKQKLREAGVVDKVQQALEVMK